MRCPNIASIWGRALAFFCIFLKLYFALNQDVALAAVSNPAALFERAVLGTSWMQRQDTHLATLMAGFFAPEDRVARKARGANLGRVPRQQQSERLVRAAVRYNARR